MLAEIEKPASLIEKLQEENKLLKDEFEALRLQNVTLQDAVQKLQSDRIKDSVSSSHEKELQELRSVFSLIQFSDYKRDFKIRYKPKPVTRFHNNSLFLCDKNRKRIDSQYFTVATIVFPLKKKVDFIELLCTRQWYVTYTERAGHMDIFFPEKSVHRETCMYSDEKGGRTVHATGVVALPLFKIRLEPDDLFYQYREDIDSKVDHYFVKGKTLLHTKVSVLSEKMCFDVLYWQVEVKKTKSKKILQTHFWEKQPNLLIGKRIFIGSTNDDDTVEYDFEGIVVAYDDTTLKHLIYSEIDHEKYAYNLKYTIYSMGDIKENDYDWIMPSEYMMYEEEDETTTSETAC